MNDELHELDEKLNNNEISYEEYKKRKARINNKDSTLSETIISSSFDDNKGSVMMKLKELRKKHDEIMMVNGKKVGYEDLTEDQKARFDALKEQAKNEIMKITKVSMIHKTSGDMQAFIKGFRKIQLILFIVISLFIIATIFL